MNEDEIKNILMSEVLDGLIEIVSGENDELAFSLTNYGAIKAEEMIAEKGLPFLLLLESKKALSECKNTNVSAMATKIITKFPNKLKQLARRNFAPLWGEFKNMTAEEYIQTYENAESENQSDD